MKFQWLVILALVTRSVSSLKVSVFGASGGVGQLICNKLLNTPGITSVNAISRSAEALKEFPLLKGCSFVEADALKSETHAKVLACDLLVLNLGTTAFPTKKWDGNPRNDPPTACLKTVETILRSIKSSSTKSIKKIVLLSSIGVERADQFPFKILNSFGVLDAKRDSEKLLFQYADQLGYQAIVVRPGRLVGAPFTNFDLAKALNLDQGENKGIIVDTRDVLAGDMERADVATAIAKLLVTDLVTNKVMFSIINKPGKSPNDQDWGKLFSLFTVPEEDVKFTRQS